jgi:heavy metal sensor kinase
MGTYSFPFDAAMLPGKLHWQWDDTELKPGHRVRRVILKVQGFRIYMETRPKGGKGGGKDSGGPFRAPPEWTIYVQGACDLDRQDASLAGLRQQLDKDRDDLVAESDESLRKVWIRLIGIGLLTFAATLAGGLLLVWLGLRPLSRLGDAVSLVSEKDFRLPMDPARLPDELRPIAERLGETLHQLKRAFAREKQAAADISHELRTPLAALMAAVDVALRKPRAAEEYRRVLEECQGIGEQMGEMVEKLLALARLDAGATSVRTRFLDAAEIADQCAALVRPLAEARGLRLRVQDNGPALLTTDAEKLREVVTNLLHNAIEYNRPQGSVELSVARDNGQLRIQVRDTGIGIPAEAREHIFERFYRADPSRQADNAHAGIGLAIVKGYVDLLGGTIQVESTLGEGTTFTINLPAKE